MAMSIINLEYSNSWKLWQKSDIFKSQNLIKLLSLQSGETAINHHVYKQWPKNDSDINIDTFSCLCIDLICLLHVWIIYCQMNE